MTSGVESFDDSVRVLIVDDHAMVADALQLALGQVLDMKVVGVATTLPAALRLVDVEEPDVVVLDYVLKGADGADGIAELIARRPAMSVLVFSGRSDEESIRTAVRAGCAGYLQKDQSLSALIQAVRVVHAGGTVFSPQQLRLGLGSRPSAPPLGGDLTDREREILQLMADGLAITKIAETLGIRVSTARNHVQNIFTKLRAHSRLEAVLIAMREGLIAPG